MTVIQDADGPDIRAGRLGTAELERNFGDAHPPLTRSQAPIEASRCYFCYDAPCVEACPTGIDIPSFIRSIAPATFAAPPRRSWTPTSWAACGARVCPVEELCEEACVRNTHEDKPVAIGMLQRYATDAAVRRGGRSLSFAPRRPAASRVVGAGPAGLACAHRLALHGHDVTVFEARGKAGGLNEYGIAAYKTPDDFAQREVDFNPVDRGDRDEGRHGAGARRDAGRPAAGTTDAVFLGLGHNAVRALGLDGEAMSGVQNAVDYIADLRPGGGEGGTGRSAAGWW